MPRGSRRARAAVARRAAGGGVALDGGAPHRAHRRVYRRAGPPAGAGVMRRGDRLFWIYLAAFAAILFAFYPRTYAIEDDFNILSLSPAIAVSWRLAFAVAGLFAAWGALVFRGMLRREGLSSGWVALYFLCAGLWF